MARAGAAALALVGARLAHEQRDRRKGHRQGQEAEADIGVAPAETQDQPLRQLRDEKPAEPDEMRDRLAHDMAKKANLERQAALKNDSEKLLKLATELKDYVDKTDEHVLSLEVIKKADEIEKLAKSVRDKMKGPN